MPEDIIQIDQHMFETKLGRLVTDKVAEILNAMLEKETDQKRWPHTLRTLLSCTWLARILG
ncbi:hypothetical protein [Pseudoscardovia suis]|uniref:hypothetical protein n=1 Tax=Pseudoscardovia suis TaxID=987063 RepID=UPI003F962CDC